MEVSTQGGRVTLAAEGITIGRSSATVGALLRQPRFIPRDEIAGVGVHDGSRYLTGTRVAGAVLTGGVALLVPKRRRASLTIVLSGGEIITLRLTVARQAEGVAIFARSLGYVS